MGGQSTTFTVEDLGGGMSLYTVPGGVTVVGGADLLVEATQVDPGEEFGADPGENVEGQVAIGMVNDGDEAALAEEYEALGRSPVADAIAAGIDGEFLASLMEDWAQYQLSGTGTQQVVGGGRIYSSFCVHDGSGNVEWDGAWSARTTRTTPTPRTTTTWTRPRRPDTRRTIYRGSTCGEAGSKTSIGRPM
jgi:hypothetical protein